MADRFSRRGVLQTIGLGTVVANACKALLFFVLIGVLGSESSAAEAELQLTTFTCDITPPVNQPVGLGFIPIATTVEHPLLAKGVVLMDGDDRYVLCAIDWMEVHNSSYDLLRETLAKAAGTGASRVAVHALHQHTAPAIDSDSQALQLDANDARRVATAKYLDHVSRQLADAVKNSLTDLQPLTHVGTSQAKVERVASNRRIEARDGSIRGRMSSTKDLSLQEAAEGLVDPFLKTVSLFNGDRAVVQLHYYATHPQSFYGDGRITYDTVGIARERLEKSAGVVQIYFTGCGGNIAMGKYNNGSRDARTDLTNRIHDAMARSVKAVARKRISRLGWKTVSFAFPVREDAAFTEKPNRDVLANMEAKFVPRLKAAINLVWIERMRQQETIELSCLSLGEVQILHLPGEPFVQYQLAAQQMQPERFVAVAGYGDCGMGYIGVDRIFTDKGGYEQTYSFAGPCEKPLLAAIAKLLSDGATAD